MRYWVQCHSLLCNGGQAPYDNHVGIECNLDIVTDKEYASEAVGDTVFLVLRDDMSDSPDKYYLWARFQCKGVKESAPGEYKQWSVYGEGWILEESPGRKLKQEADFLSFLEYWRNGSNSLYFKEISGSPFVRKLLEISEKYKPREYADEDEHLEDEVEVVTIVPPVTTTKSISSTERNKKVEIAAVDYVVSLLKEKGWKGKSVEKENLGYDYKFWKGEQELHAEIKGLSGKDVVFILTENEYKTLKEDPKSCIFVVTHALTSTPKHHLYTQDQFLKEFSMKPVAYRATRR